MSYNRIDTEHAEDIEKILNPDILERFNAWFDAAYPASEYSSNTLARKGCTECCNRSHVALFYRTNGMMYIAVYSDEYGDDIQLLFGSTDRKAVVNEIRKQYPYAKMYSDGSGWYLGTKSQTTGHLDIKKVPVVGEEK